MHCRVQIINKSLDTTSNKVLNKSLNSLFKEYRNKKFFKEDYEELIFFRNSIRYHNHSIHIENKLLQQIKDSIPTYLLSYLIILTRGESSLEENK